MLERANSDRAIRVTKLRALCLRLQTVIREATEVGEHRLAEDLDDHEREFQDRIRQLESGHAWLESLGSARE